MIEYFAHESSNAHIHLGGDSSTVILYFGLISFCAIGLLILAAIILSKDKKVVSKEEIKE